MTLSNGTHVLVSLESPSGKPMQTYQGSVLDTRIGVQCIGSVEYLIASSSGSKRWVAGRFVTPLAQESKTDGVKGTVTWFNDTKGYGMLAIPGFNRAIFCHYSAITHDGFKTLAEGQTVQFDLVDGPHGPQAANVRKVA